jgi:hypothetical protein
MAQESGRETRISGTKKFILRSTGKKCVRSKTVEYENRKFNQNEGNLKKKIIRILSSLRMSLLRRGMLTSSPERQLLIACGKTTELQQHRTNTDIAVSVTLVVCR